MLLDPGSSRPLLRSGQAAEGLPCRGVAPEALGGGGEEVAAVVGKMASAGVIEPGLLHQVVLATSAYSVGPQVPLAKP